MRHALKGRKFNRTSSHRLAMLQNMAVSLIFHEQITTTLPKAKDLRPVVEKLVTLGKKDDLNSLRKLNAILQDINAVNKLRKILSVRYKNRNGGYLRIVKAGFRYGDAAPMAVIEFVERNIEAKGKDYSNIEVLKELFAEKVAKKKQSKNTNSASNSEQTDSEEK